MVLKLRATFFVQKKDREFRLQLHDQGGNSLSNILLKPLFLVVLCTLIGQFTGRWGYKYFKLGSSATLFIGLFISYISGVYNIELATIPKPFFTASLIFFIVAVGLKASQSIREILKTYGIRFLILGLVVTSSGAITTYVMLHMFSEVKFEIIGTYVGALTSSPGLATALEISKEASSAAVGLGYAIAYIPGVLVVIIFSQWLSKFKVNTLESIKTKDEKKRVEEFSISKFMIVIVMGMLLGSVEINIGTATPFSLGMTGGTLISALFFGSTVKGFEFNNNSLEVIQELGLNAFLAIVGLTYGFVAVNAVQSAGLQLLIIGIITGSFSVLMGYIVGKYILKMESVILIGGICGGMTSTPGLAAALEAFDSDDVVLGYGATYPFALIGVIIYTNIMF